MCKHDDGCNVPEGECSGACMKQGETLDHLCERYPAMKALREENERIQRSHEKTWDECSAKIADLESQLATLQNDLKNMDHARRQAFGDKSIGEGVAAMREENERLNLALMRANNVKIENSEASLMYRIADLESQLAELRQGGEAVGEVCIYDCPGFDVEWSGTIPPHGTKLYTRPQPAIPPGYVVVPLIPTRAMEEVVNQDEWQWEDLLAAAEAITEDQYNEIASAPAIQPQAAATMAEQTDGAETAWSIAGRLALELECLLLDTKDTAIVSKWWDTAHEALEDYRLVRNAAPAIQPQAASVPVAEKVEQDAKDAAILDWLEKKLESGRIEIARSLYGSGYEVGFHFKNFTGAIVRSGDLREALFAMLAQQKDGA